MKVLLIGATGLVGSRCLDLLLQDPVITTVVAPVRRNLTTSHPKLQAPVVDFDNLDSFASELKADAVISALGTTLRKAGSTAAFTRVDYGYQVKLAEIAFRNGAGTIVLLSSAGADKHSLIFYSRIKGETEEAVSRIGYQTCIILRPSLLLGARTEPRTAEAFGQWIALHLPWMFAGPMSRYKAVPAETVAAALAKAVQKPMKGRYIVENLKIFDWAKN